MQIRKLGNTGLEVSAIGYGCMGFSFAYGQPTAKKRKPSRSCERQWIVVSISSIPPRYRPIHKRRIGWRSVEPNPRPRHHRDQVWI